MIEVIIISSVIVFIFIIFIFLIKKNNNKIQKAFNNFKTIYCLVDNELIRILKSDRIYRIDEEEDLFIKQELDNIDNNIVLEKNMVIPFKNCCIQKMKLLKLFLEDKKNV